jgi:hypothetical protein
LDTSVLQVEWLGVEHAKQEVGGLSAGGHKARVFHVKNHQTCDFCFRCSTVWLSSGVSPNIKKNLFFQPTFGVFWKPHHCRFAYVGSKSGSEGGFEPTVI